jgi:hypothetical protein
MALCCLALTLLGLLGPAHALDNGLGLTPLLAYNSWNIFACAVNETVMKQTMDAFVSTGLRDAGYTSASSLAARSFSRAAPCALSALSPSRAAAPCAHHGPSAPLSPTITQPQPYLSTIAGLAHVIQSQTSSLLTPRPFPRA